MKTNRDCENGDHIYGEADGSTTTFVRMTKKWYKKCFVCQSRQACASMVRCIRCRVVVHYRCVCWKKYDEEATQKMRDRRAADFVDVGTNTRVTTATDVATNTENATTNVAATNTETITAVDESTNTVAIVQVHVATDTETTTTDDAATNTENTTAIDVWTNTEGRVQNDVATNTETTTTVVVATNTETITAVHVSTSTGETVQNEVATNTETTVEYVDNATNTETAEKIDTAGEDKCTDTEAAKEIELAISSAQDDTIVAGKSAISQDNGSSATCITNNTAPEMEIHFKSGPICALQELCMIRNWTLPKYEFYEAGDSKVFTFSVECTVLTHTVRVERMFKKDGKRQAALLMYHKVKSMTSSDVPCEKDSKKIVNENVSMGNGIFSGASAGIDKNSAIANFVDTPVPTFGDDINAANFNKVTTLEMTKEAAHNPASLTRHDIGPLVDITKYPKCNDSFVRSAVDSEVTAINEEEKPLFSTEYADLANQLRLSNNPSVRQLKELNSISKITVPSCIQLVHQIVSEENLAIEYDMTSTNTTLIIRKYFTAAQLVLSPGALTVVGQGETVSHSQEDAAFKCLTCFKTMLEEN